MNQLFKTLLILLLALTLPVHVMAASLIPMMQAAHRSQAPVVANTHLHLHMHHDGMEMTADITPSKPADDHQVHDMKQCPSCGACCMPAVLAQFDVLPKPHPQGLMAMQFFSPYLPSPAPHRLDRPPRYALV